MVGGKLHKFIKNTSKSKTSSFRRRQHILDQVREELHSNEYNPRKARNKSLRGITFANK